MHTTTFIERQKELGYEGKGLAYWAEQASEHCQHDWNVTWQGSNYARALGHDDYDSQLKKPGISTIPGICKLLLQICTVVNSCK